MILHPSLYIRQNSELFQMTRVKELACLSDTNAKR